LVLSHGLSMGAANKIGVDATIARRIYRVFINVVLRLTKKAEPCLPRGVNHDSGTASARHWLRQFVNFHHKAANETV
jgi:hypothetical protein